MPPHRPATTTLGLLASKIHPPLPLSPRESQQLHELLTTSFRAHLDREHPVGAKYASSHKQVPPRSRRSSFSNGPRLSSHFAATQHLDSILTNPLFAVKPSQPALPRTVLNTLFQDPMGWFFEQIALGAADIQGLQTCLKVADQIRASEKGPSPFRVPKGKRTASTQIASWLGSRPKDTNEREILQHPGLLHRLVELFAEEGNEHKLWRWFALDPTQITGNGNKFRANLLRAMVRTKLDSNPPSIDDAVGIFLHAAKKTSQYSLSSELLIPANRAIVKCIADNPGVSITLERYNLFVDSTRSLTSKWNDIFESCLQLNHPSHPSADLALAVTQRHAHNPTTLIGLKPGKREFLVQMYLRAARQLLTEKNFDDAQLVLRCTQELFPELVGADYVSTKKHEDESGKTPSKNHPERRDRKKEDELRNLDLLDRLLPI